jgi:hypothetical protein
MPQIKNFTILAVTLPLAFSLACTGPRQAKIKRAEIEAAAAAEAYRIAAEETARMAEEAAKIAAEAEADRIAAEEAARMAAETAKR